MNQPKGNYRMKFVGRPDGKLMKNAPGNFIHGKEYMVPYNHAQWPFWELLEEEPKLIIGESDADSVYDEVYVADEDIVQETISVEPPTMTSSDGYNFDPTAPAKIEPYIMFNPGSGETKAVDRAMFSEPEPSDEEKKLSRIEQLKAELSLLEASPVPEAREEVVEEAEEVLDRNELLGILTEAGKVIKKGTRTTTLKKMVDNLVAEE